jgi:hypothetical protein
MFKQGVRFPIEEYLTYLTHEVPAPTSGKSVTFNLPDGKEYTIESNKINEKPFIDNSAIFELFFSERYLSITNFLYVFAWFL